MNNFLGNWKQAKEIRATWYFVGILAIVVSVVVSIHAILR
jgi:predicted nucleic acid-binding Zn ribbon protein